MREQLVTRPAQPSDAPHITRLIIDRKFDADPWTQEQNEAGIARWRERGDAINRYGAELARDLPYYYFMRVATIGSAVVGYIKGKSTLDNDAVHWSPCVDHGGLMVDAGYESRGVAQQLEWDFYRWSLSKRKTICVRVSRGNARARTFFELQGYEFRQRLVETNTSPELDVLFLERHKVQENYYQGIAKGRLGAHGGTPGILTADARAGR